MAVLVTGAVVVAVLVKKQQLSNHSLQPTTLAIYHVCSHQVGYIFQTPYRGFSFHLKHQKGSRRQHFSNHLKELALA